MGKILSAEHEITVRFSEVDSMGIVWHGHYIKFFEDGREAFGKQYGIGYMDIYDQGFMAPVVDINCQYKKVVRYNDKIKVRTTFENAASAKIIFHFEILDSSNKILATGKSTQVFMTPEGELYLTMPTFFVEWKKKWGII